MFLRISRTYHKTILLSLFLVSLTLVIYTTTYYTSLGETWQHRWNDFKHVDAPVPRPTSTSTATSASEDKHDADCINATLLESAPKYVKAILDPSDTAFERLVCTPPTHTRYEYLRDNSTAVEHVESKSKPRYFFALDLRQCAKLLPRLVGTLIEAIRFLGIENCALSIVEGRSDDGTYEILYSLQKSLEELHIQYYFQTSDLNPQVSERISTLAKLRNLALQPLIDNQATFDPSTTIIFINDIALCMEDILELIHQKVYQNADMTCAMDWTYVGPDPTFYDVWIARTLTGDTFFEIPPDGSWDSAWNLFWNSPNAADGYQDHKPFQVFACWNGATAFTAKPIMEGKIKFRAAVPKKECYQGEPRLMCKDMWHLGYGKIAVIPTVNVEYSDDAARRIKELKGYVSKWVPATSSSSTDSKDGAADKIIWQRDPPEKVKCISDYAHQHWVPWNQGME